MQPWPPRSIATPQTFAGCLGGAPPQRGEPGSQGQQRWVIRGCCPETPQCISPCTWGSGASRWGAQGSTLGAPEVLEPRPAQHLLPPSPPCDFLPLAHSACLGQTTSLCTFISPFPAHFPTPPRTGPSPRAAADLGLAPQACREFGDSASFSNTHLGSHQLPQRGRDSGTGLGDGTQGQARAIVGVAGYTTVLEPGEGDSRVHAQPPTGSIPPTASPPGGHPPLAIPRTPPHIHGVPTVLPLAQEDQDESP